MTVTLITGANKGIGFETARQLLELGHVVYIGARDVERGEKAAATLGARFVQLDVTDDASVSSALATIDSAEGRLDVLVNNAGILGSEVTNGPEAVRVFDTNTVGVVRVTEAALPLLRKSSNPTVVNVSSSLGSFWAVNNPDRPEFNVPLALYSASKSAATMLTVQYAKSQPGIKFNALEPGTTATDMTAALGIGRPVEESARTVVRLATLDADGPTGTLQDENGELRW
ncbi:SDR family NAD(P)-dependent oxidoreductase [Streptomyces phaeochromogenes]|uniref:SDR family NAD(P)-dependent oxidoreductase n=1 Tax=Streptomyces phaeochromogenes TaxID=1923 RepID=A0ABZ1HCU3_STRPH|nr:SDR family NAD(P)-dependent oxidoreductase [Streptomyces phaeochromogenes]MCX5601516.1 SDR family NAD(P)-dependent oxidoreductase [Streptomyces phaeochromogenes]WRZ29409.1 SDR family NAD(P)-dependent oxidoreductase [Streptomyces phaeochromogenes]WSD15145.1 SDR family NAD(P)-dependent oxidoreductase [Streptomyces phaeochromogenes]WSJ08027.1 SDR family NAD(P)-dependent oxidoreductase [Streptomyces phaeochromogenes]WSW17458.1 SDR family NAD(P)-dependent oxidoreductase [Streptomyces phaeochromo